MTINEALIIAAKYNLVQEISYEIAYGATPEEALRDWDIL